MSNSASWCYHLSLVTKVHHSYEHGNIVFIPSQLCQNLTTSTYTDRRIQKIPTTDTALQLCVSYRDRKQNVHLNPHRTQPSPPNTRPLQIKNRYLRHLHRRDDPPMRNVHPHRLPHLLPPRLPNSLDRHSRQHLSSLSTARRQQEPR